jgi:hypothetical protein
VATSPINELTYQPKGIRGDFHISPVTYRSQISAGCLAKKLKEPAFYRDREWSLLSSFYS